MQRRLNLQFQGILFLLFPFFRGYLNPQVRINKMVNSIDYHPFPSRLASRIHLFTFLETSLGLTFSRMFVEFSFKLVYYTLCPKNFQIHGAHISRKCSESWNFYSWPPPHSKLSPSSYHYILGGRKLLISLGSFFSQKFVSPNNKKVWRRL